MNKIEYIPIEKLKTLKNNPRIIKDERFIKLKESIKKLPKFFESRPLLVNNASGELIIYAGNMRFNAAQELKMKTVPCIIESLTEEEQRERTIRDNVELGEWDFEILANEWDTGLLNEWGINVFSENAIKTNREIDTKEIENKLGNKCPKCGFLFN